MKIALSACLNLAEEDHVLPPHHEHSARNIAIRIANMNSKNVSMVNV